MEEVISQNKVRGNILVVSFIIAVPDATPWQIAEYRKEKRFIRNENNQKIFNIKMKYYIHYTVPNL